MQLAAFLSQPCLSVAAGPVILLSPEKLERRGCSDVGDKTISSSVTADTMMHAYLLLREGEAVHF